MKATVPVSLVGISLLAGIAIGAAVTLTLVLPSQARAGLAAAPATPVLMDNDYLPSRFYQEQLGAHAQPLPPQN